MDKLKITLYTGAQEEAVYHYRLPDINQKTISAGKNHRRCFYGKQKGAHGGK
jgi:hypothetical protein